MALSHEIQERVDHVLEYHRATKYTRDAVAKDLAPPSVSNQPSVYRLFESLPKVPLPTHLLDISTSTTELMNLGLEALPDSYVRPPQELKTLASWLFYAAGITQDVQVGQQKVQRRSSPSSGGRYPCEIYVAAFSIRGLDPGLYHFSVREFALRKLRDGPETLWQLKRGRPDLEFIKTVPAVLLVSTNFWRSAWKFRKRAYRHVLLDAGHQIENLSLAARGLGIQTVVRLRVTDSTSRELIGIDPHADFGTLEPVQSMIVWADQAEKPLEVPKLTGSPPPLLPIARMPLSPKPESFGTIAAVHSDCTATGVAVREIRPPLTELSPLPPTVHVDKFPEDEELESRSLRESLIKRRSPHDFEKRSISRDRLVTLARLSFRGGGYFPVFADGPHIGLVRPFWIIHDVNGMEQGIWYYHPPSDGWSLLRAGHRRTDCRHLSMEQDLGAHSSAVCWMMCNLQAVMNGVGPDAYRIAHLEAGVVGQRFAVAAQSIGLGSSAVTAFFDDEVRTFLGLGQTGWEVLYGLSVGVPAPPAEDQVVNPFERYV